MKAFMERSGSTHDSKSYVQYCSFWLGGLLYGVDVKSVQEVTDQMKMVEVRGAPSYVKGLINLRGRIATAICLSSLFGIKVKEEQDRHMTIVCELDEGLFAFLVDRVGDVVEVSREQAEATPSTVSDEFRKFTPEVFKLDDNILSVVCLENVLEELNFQDKG